MKKVKNFNEVKVNEKYKHNDKIFFIHDIKEKEIALDYKNNTFSVIPYGKFKRWVKDGEIYHIE